MHLHHQQPSRAFGDGQQFDRRRELGIGPVVDGTPQAVYVHFRRHAEDCLCPPDPPVVDPENDRSTPAVGHADRHLHRKRDGVGHAAAVPLLEVEVLILQVVGTGLVQPVEQFADFSDRSHSLLRRSSSPARSIASSSCR